ncbi:hypothetical protein [Micromonospora avicenniae]|uniref:hypothetical protein n=1 Tax=Micromonospora avicenniae TaxID=1198245 RepID=UPI00332724EB
MQILPEFVRGVAEIEVTPRGIRPHRLPAWVREQFPDGQLLSMESQPPAYASCSRRRRARSNW